MSQPPYPIHPSVVDRVDPVYKAFYNEFEINNPPPQEVPIHLARENDGPGPGTGSPLPVGKTTDLTIPRVETSGPDIPIRCFIPAGPQPSAGWPVLVHYHGGGWVFGGLDSEKVILTNICSRGKCVVVSTDYRLAPEHPFPAGIEDSWEALLWVISKGKDVLSLNVSKVAISGTSAGGNIAAAICQRAISKGLPNIRLQLLLVPALDNSATPSNNVSWAENEHAPALEAYKMLWFRQHYLPNRSDWENPEASPLLWKGDWSKLPPAFILVGELDILRSEAEQYGQKLKDAGVEASVRTGPGLPHHFIMLDGPLEVARQSITWCCEALLTLSNE